MSYNKFDEKIARSLQDQFNCTGITENAVFPKEKEKGNYRPRTLVDETLEYIDPTPNIYTLFVQFNEKFFWNVLLPVQVKWSPRMTSCAGICSFHPRNKECVIALSTPLLKLRPRKDLVETLLHEMIHAYLFLTNDNRDRDGHGPIFQSHMHRINKAAGTKISIYHTFHEEVKLYQQHWWRCNGPCQKRAPYFGTVKRAMNRAPGPNDFWWTEHMANCGGQFIKIKEPEKPEKKKAAPKKQNNVGTNTKAAEKNAILNWIKKPDLNASNSTQNKNSSRQSNLSSNKSNNSSNISTDLKKLGNSTNNVHGWGTGGPNGTSTSNRKSTTNANTNMISKSNQGKSLSFSGTLGGTGSGRSNLLDKYSNPFTSSHRQSTSNTSLVLNKSSDCLNAASNTKKKTVLCPNCRKNVEEDMINQHLDKCLENANEPEVVDITLSKKRKSEDSYSTSNKMFKTDSVVNSSDIECPLCSIRVKIANFNQHLDICADNGSLEKEEDEVVSLLETSSGSVNLQDSPHLCLICEKVLEPNVTLNEHLEECVASVFNESNDDDMKELETDKTEKVGKYPCPVCMTLIDETAMNTHLDLCLK